MTSKGLTPADLWAFAKARADNYGGPIFEDLWEALMRRPTLTHFRDDIRAVLDTAPGEVVAVRDALLTGRVDGSVYLGSCACLVGIIARAQHHDAEEVPGLPADSDRPAERFFMGINAGDTPGTNPFSALALDWVNEWLAEHLSKNQG